MTTSDGGSAFAPLRGWSRTSWLIAAALSGAVVGLLAIRVATPLLVVVAIAGILFAVIVLAEPEVGLLALVFVTYTNLSDVLVGHFGAPPTLMKFLVPLVALALFTQWLRRRHSLEGWLQPTLLLAAYGFAGLLSLPAAMDTSVTVAELMDLIKDGVVMILVVVLIRRIATLRRVFWTFLVGGLLMGTVTVHQAISGNFDWDYWGFALKPVTWSATGEAVHRVSGSIGNPNSYGLILLLFIPIAIDRIVNSDRFAPRLTALWTLAVCALSIVFTYSRGAFVALVLVVVAMLVIHRPRPRYVVLALAMAAVMSPLVPASYIDRVESLVDVVRRPRETIGFQDASLRGRFSENLAAVRMFLDHPINGVGLGNYPLRYQEYSQELMLDPRSTERATHNLYLEITSETGIVGVMAFGLTLWFLARGILKARRALTDSRLRELKGMVDAVAIALIGYLGGSLFLHATHMRYFWLLAGIALALPRIAAEEREALSLESSRSADATAGG